MTDNIVELPITLALKDLARSALDEDDYKRLKYEALTRDETMELTNGRWPARSYKIPYIDPLTNKPTKFFRLRFLDQCNHKGKEVRYWQPVDEAPHAYFAPGIDWPKVLADTTVEIWMTEGEKKAASLCKHNVPCIGLGGVWNWKSNARRQPLIPDLMMVQLTGRSVKLCFDSDPEPKPLVTGALESLGHILEQRGATVYQVVLPRKVDDEKIGLDDYLAKHKVKSLMELEANRLVSSGHLVKLNDELVVVENPSAVLHIATGQMLSPKKLAEVLYANRRMPGIDSAGRLIEVSAVTEWMKWQHRRIVRELTYEPGQGRIYDSKWNLWNGLAVAPKVGDVRPFKRVFEFLTESLPDDLRKWFLQWLAYPLQHPGTKLYTSVVLWSRETGLCKTLLGYTMNQIYGENAAVITEAELHSQYNDWLAKKQFILGEEITGSDNRKEANKLKHIITGETIRINRKYEVQYELKNLANFLFTSNMPDAFQIEDKDRRYFVIEVRLTPNLPPAEWIHNTYDPWFRSHEGAAAILDHLLRVDTKNFDPKARAPMTEAKANMIAVSGSEADYLARQLMQYPDKYLRIGDEVIKNRDLFELDELLIMMQPYNNQLRPMTLARALLRHGSLNWDSTKTSRGKLRLWVIRNVDKWSIASHQERAQHYNDAFRINPPRF
ncbi:MAG: DUF3854 domain-containing protein [Patescibacteria group bacterium]|nr:DUF3854 domain-containing protein [Patescibacteria group bacterium]